MLFTAQQEGRTRISVVKEIFTAVSATPVTMLSAPLITEDVLSVVLRSCKPTLPAAAGTTSAFTLTRYRPRIRLTLELQQDA